MKGLPRSNSRGAARRQEIVRTSIKIEDLAVAVANGSGAPGIGSAVLGDFPTGRILFLGAVIRNLIFTSSDADVIATWEGDFAVGTVPNADADLTDATDFNIIASTALGPAVAKATPAANATSTPAAPPQFFDNSDGSLEINLNVLIDDASQSGAVDLVANGVIELAYIVF